MKSVTLALTVAALVFATPAIAQLKTLPASSQADFSGYKAYVVLDQSRDSDRMREAMKHVCHPDLIALNQVKGDFYRVSDNAEKHPLIYVYDKPGVARQIESPDEFVRFMNKDMSCPGE